MYKATKNKMASFLAFLFYLFLPISAIAHTNIYMSDILVQLFFVSSILFFYQIIDNNDKKSVYFWLYGVSIFLMTYTDWLGFLFALTIIVYSIFQKDKTIRKKLILINISIPIFSLTLFITQYLTIFGFSNFVNVFIEKYTSSYSKNDISINLSNQIYNFIHHYSSLKYLIFIMIILGLMYLASGLKNKIQINKKFISILSIILVTCLLHNIIFFNWASYYLHGFSAVKFMVFISLFSSYVFYLFWFGLEFKNRKIVFTVSFLFLIILFYNSLKIYKFIAFPTTLSSAQYCLVGEQIGKIAENEEVIFIQDRVKFIHVFPISPVFNYCAKRNIEIYTGDKDAFDLIRKNNTNKGIIFTIGYYADGLTKISGIEKINLD